MVGRRKTARVAIRDGAQGLLYVSEDVQVERVSSSEVVVLSSVSLPRGEELRIWLHYADGTSKAVVARASDRTPALVDGLIRHRIQLEIVAPQGQKDA